MITFNAILSIPVTSAFTLQVFHSSSLNSNVNSPSPVKVWPVLQPLLVTRISLLHPVKLTTTSLLVGGGGLSTISQVGIFLSIVTI